jgi:lipoprotein-anchoring transpeptidase ErfK/SrfK
MIMVHHIRRSMFAAVLAAVVGMAGGLPTPAAAQQAASRSALLSHPQLRASPVVERGDYLVVVDLDENRLHFMQGREVLWSAPVGTGMDLKLEAGNRKWEFTTAPGEYQVQLKEENPVWLAPDWYFIENKLPVPPQEDPRRRMPGGLGVAAVHIGRGLAIHGTDKPDLLGQRVSHGCIRLANEYAQRLYHNVQVGTKVLIISREERGELGRLIPGQVPGTGPVDARTQRIRDQAKAERLRLANELNARTTAALLERLDRELGSRNAAAGSAARWTETASVLIRRAVKDGDAAAARGLLERVDEVRNPRLRSEYATFLADLYWRASPAVTHALAEMDRRPRQAAAEVIVQTTMSLFGPGADEAIAPWPTRRIPRTVLAEEAQPGWDAIEGAEREYRQRRTSHAVTRTGTGRL